ncbi:MAG TPA: ornithine cyclodeaminase family protein, partial [Myxococcaceae bacterium]|nr:ornithine cyclodeaminase family protein [Myxococcaceae bacterium]
MSTLLLTRTDVIRHIDALLLLSEMREAFRRDAEARSVVPQRARAPLHAEGTAQVLFPGSLPGLPAWSVKVHAKFPGHSPAIQGVVQLQDWETGALLAVMDSGHLTALRTGMVGALAADVLARPEASRVALIGAGAQASLQLKSLRLVRSLTHVRVYDTQLTRAVEFGARMYQA